MPTEITEKRRQTLKTATTTHTHRYTATAATNGGHINSKHSFKCISTHKEIKC